MGGMQHWYAEYFRIILIHENEKTIRNIPPPPIPDLVYWSIEKSVIRNIPPNPHMVSLVTSMYSAELCAELCPEYLEQNKKEIKKSNKGNITVLFISLLKSVR